MIDFLINNLDFFLIFFIAVIVSIIMARRGQIKKIKEIVLALCSMQKLHMAAARERLRESFSYRSNI